MTPTEALEKLEELREDEAFIGRPVRAAQFVEIAAVIIGLQDDAKLTQVWADANNAKLTVACKLVLLFHSGSPWDFEKQQAWANGLTDLLGPVAGRDPKIVGAHGDGTWDGAEPTNEATTKNLCNAVRAALKE